MSMADFQQVCPLQRALTSMPYSHAKVLGTTLREGCRVAFAAHRPANVLTPERGRNPASLLPSGVSACQCRWLEGIEQERLCPEADHAP